MEEDKKGQGVTEEQLVLEFMQQNPEYVMKRVDRAIDRLVEEHIEVLREDFEKRFDQTIKEVMIRIAGEQFADIITLPNKYMGEKPLRDTFRDLAIVKAAEKVRTLFWDFNQMQVKMWELEQRLNEDDGDWWKRGGPPPESLE